MSLLYPPNPWCEWCDVWRLTTTPASTSNTLFEQWCGVFYVPHRLQNSRVFFSKSVQKSVKRGVRVLRARSARASHARRACEARGKKRLSPVSLSVFSLVPDLLFDCSRLLEYAKIRTVLQSTSHKNQISVSAVRRDLRFFCPYPEKTRKSNRLLMSLQRQHFLLSYFKTLSVCPAGVWTRDPPLSRPEISQLS